MSAQRSSTETQSTVVYLGQRSFAETPTSVLADSLEAQHDRGEPLNQDMVWEVLSRLLVAEDLIVPARAD